MSTINKFNSILPSLIDEASHSTINSQLAAALLKGQKMISRPCSNTSRNMCRGQTCGSLHAEAHAILDYFGKDLTFSPKLGWIYQDKKGKNQASKKFDLIVIRVNNDGDLCISRPCFNCLNMMKAVNIHKVYYIDNNNNMVSETVKHMISIHASSVARYIHAVKSGLNFNDSEKPFFQKLMKEMIPPEVKKANFENFINHDLKNVLPDHSYVIKNDNGVDIVIILDGNKNEVITRRLVS